MPGARIPILSIPVLNSFPFLSSAQLGHVTPQRALVAAELTSACTVADLVTSFRVVRLSHQGGFRQQGWDYWPARNPC